MFEPEKHLILTRISYMFITRVYPKEKKKFIADIVTNTSRELLKLNVRRCKRNAHFANAAHSRRETLRESKSRK